MNKTVIWAAFSKTAGKIKFLICDGFLHIFFGSTLNKAIAFISSIVIIQLVSKSDYGYLTYVDNLYSYVGLFTGLGMSTAIMKFCTPTTDMGDDKYYLMFSLKYGCIIQLLLSFVLILYVSLVDITFPEAKPLIYLKVLYPSSAYAITLLQSYMRSQGRYKLYSYISIIQTVVILMSSIGLAFLFSVYGVVLARYIGLALALILAAHYLKKQFLHIQEKKIAKSEMVSYLKMSTSMMLADIFSSVIVFDELFLVSMIFKDESITASYKVAVLLPSQLLFVIGAVVVYVFPKIAKEEKTAAALKKIKLVAVYSFFIIAAIATVGIICNQYLIGILFGNSYVEAIPLSNLYWITFFINTGLRIMPVQMLSATGKAKINAYALAATAILHIGVFYYVVSKFGLMAGAVSTGIIYFISAIVSWGLLLYNTKDKE